jgi:hypothetical protein
MNESKGLGDSIEKIARRSRIKQLVESFSKKTGKDCGCKKRQEKLNTMFPYKTKKNEDV